MRLSKLQSTVHIVYFASVVIRVTRGDDPHFKIIYSVKKFLLQFSLLYEFFSSKTDLDIVFEF